MANSHSIPLVRVTYYYWDVNIWFIRCQFQPCPHSLISMFIWVGFDWDSQLADTWLPFSSIRLSISSRWFSQGKLLILLIGWLIDVCNPFIKIIKKKRRCYNFFFFFLLMCRSWLLSNPICDVAATVIMYDICLPILEICHQIGRRHF